MFRLLFVFSLLFYAAECATPTWLIESHSTIAGHLGPVRCSGVKMDLGCITHDINRLRGTHSDQQLLEVHVQIDSSADAYRSHCMDSLKAVSQSTINSTLYSLQFWHFSFDESVPCHHIVAYFEWARSRRLNVGVDDLFLSRNAQECNVTADYFYNFTSANVNRTATHKTPTSFQAYTSVCNDPNLADSFAHSDWRHAHIDEGLELYLLTPDFWCVTCPPSAFPPSTPSPPPPPVSSSPASFSPPTVQPQPSALNFFLFPFELTPDIAELREAQKMQEEAAQKAEQEKHEEEKETHAVKMFGSEYMPYLLAVFAGILGLVFGAAVNIFKKDD
eukprot:TRINITY_DN4728_c0_g1_i1.p1 TRINITY_DN4728_c0_g1~~TRINITY_DN4728_c0_g1_i1.p1  ORF type:complete len:332 (+),score=34.49 TRINITY_DN4728_c0_g1_i1:61-1056(+)